MKQVAAKAGVSTATVARYIHKNGYISHDAEQRVRSAIQSTGYQINTIAQSLRRQRTCTIAHILESAMPNPFFIHVALGAKTEAHDKDYQIIEYNVQHDPAIEKKAVEMFISRRVDAILFTTPLDPDNVSLAQSSGIPIVQIEKPCIDNTDSILIDNYVGAQSAMRHLIELGHRRIAYIGVDPTTEQAHYSDRERFGAYADTLQANHIPLDSDLIAYGEIYSSTDIVSVGIGAESTDRFLDRPEIPTAIFAAGDNLAAGVMQSIHKHGLRVPEDISVIGFDDTYSPYLAPPLTTVKMPMQMMGREGVRLALEHIHHESESRSPQIVTLKTELVIRQSTAEPKRSHI